MLRTRIEDRDGIPALVLGRQARCDVRHVNRASDGSWGGAIAEEEARPFHFETGLLVRFIHVHGSQKSELVLYGQHSICDGRSLAALLVRIVDLCNGVAPSLHYDFRPLSSPRVERRPSPLASLLAATVFGFLNWRWKRQSIRFNENDFIRLHRAFHSKYRYECSEIECSPTETSAIIANSKKSGATVNSAICVAIAFMRVGPRGRSVASSLAYAGAAEYPGMIITNLRIVREPEKVDGGLRLESFHFRPSAVPLPRGNLIIGIQTYSGRLCISINAMLERGEFDLHLENEIGSGTRARSRASIGFLVHTTMSTRTFSSFGILK
jgi:hypothetical protein